MPLESCDLEASLVPREGINQEWPSENNQQHFAEILPLSRFMMYSSASVRQAVQ